MSAPTPTIFTSEQEARIAEIAAAVIASMQCRQQNRHLGLLSIAVTNPAFADRIQSVIDGKSAPEPRSMSAPRTSDSTQGDIPMDEGKSAPASGGTVIGTPVYDPRPFTPEQEARIREITAATMAEQRSRRPSPPRLRR